MITTKTILINAHSLLSYICSDTSEQGVMGRQETSYKIKH